MKTRIGFILILAMCLINACTFSGLNQNSEKVSVDERKGKADQRVLTSLYTDLIGALETTNSRAGSLSSEYPQYFGGACIEDGRLLIYLATKEDLVLAKKDLASKIDTTNVIFRGCENSYQSLLDLTEKLRVFFYEEGNQNLLDELHIDGWGPNKKENKVIIKLKDCTPQYIEEFKSKVIDSPLIGFAKSHGRVKVQATGYIIGRSQVTNHRGSVASIGYRVNSSTLGHGFLVSGHFANATNYSVKIGSITLGTCRMTQCSGNIDAAFIKYQDENSYTISNTATTPSNGTITLNTSVDYVGDSGTVYISGYHTKTSGGVIDTDQVTIEEETKNYISKCTSVLYTQSPIKGGSGALIYSANNNVVGLHFGVDEYGFGYYCLASEIHKAFGLSRY